MGEREKYEQLGIDKAIHRPCDYSTACHELSAVLRLAYSDLPKTVQSLVLQDILSAFRILPQVQTGHEKSSANLLLQSAEAVLPKQKKSLVSKEFKHSIIAYKRRSSKSIRQSVVNWQLPQDILIHILSFLDMRSLVSASSVCTSWKYAANENSLWKTQYSIFFGNCSDLSRKKYEFDWKNAFRENYYYLSYLNVGTSTNRVICMNCESTIWLSNLTSLSPHSCPKLGRKHGKRIRLVSPNKVAEFLLGESELSEFSSDSDRDSDSDEKVEIRRKFFHCIAKEGENY
ncbi:hypothetical protein LUZ60_000568 [Juncus effusus]|nr:hypothetical protein LUZ60_000568 [Juncus effusus]